MGRRQVRLLWEVCGIPDFRKLADDTHTAAFARGCSAHLAGPRGGHPGRVPTEWLDAGIAGLSKTEGDIDTLMARLSGVRVWSYIAARTDWVAGRPSLAGGARGTWKTSCRMRCTSG